MTLQQETLIAAGVKDTPAARAFCSQLCWTERQAQESVAFCDMHGSVRTLFGLDDLAADQGRPGAGLGTVAAIRTQNLTTGEEACAARDSGFTTLKSIQKISCNGNSGDWLDPDCHVREFAMNPFRPLVSAGRPKFRHAN